MPIHLRCLHVTLLFFVMALALRSDATPCPVAQAHTPSAADLAVLKGRFDEAVKLYESDLAQAQSPEQKAELTTNLSHTLLRQQKPAEAAALVEKALATDPQSPVLLTALGEVRYRSGTPWLAAASVQSANNLNPCYGRTHLLAARLLRLNSAYKSSAAELTVAYQLDPHDPGIRLQWLETLPVAQRITELETFLAADMGQDTDELRHLHEYLDHLKKTVATPRRACRLVSDTSTAEVPFASMMRDANHLRSYGLDVKLNGRSARLQIDTGASGLVVSRSVAEHAGLQRFSNESMGGVGDKGEKGGYTAYADSIRIGALEFHDCEVDVVDSRNILDTDGLIGPDVFARFLVTLDYPMRKLILGPLPKRPDDIVAPKPTLETGSTGDEEAAAPEPGPAQSNPGQPQVNPAAVATPANSSHSRLHDRYIAPEMQDWTRVYRVGHQLIVPTIMNDHPLAKLMILDTGAFTTSVTPDVAREVTKISSDEQTRIYGLSGQIEKVYTADHIEFKFGMMRQEGRGVTSFAIPQVSRRLGMEIAGFLGIRTLGQLTLSIDYRDALVHFVYDPSRGFKYQTY